MKYFHHKKQVRRGAGNVQPWWAKAVDILVYPIGIAGVVSATPQIIKIWVDHNAVGVSPFSWWAWTALSVFWMLYGIVHKTKATIIINILWIGVNAVIAVGALVYG